MSSDSPSSDSPSTSVPAPRPFRFGLQVSSAGSREEWVSLAKRAEALGYSVLTMPDHFDGQFAPVPALQCGADATSTLRFGALVYDNDYKHPAILAKELATMDVLSDGRVEIGLGAGWMETDYRALGIPYDAPGVRVSRFIEGVEVIRGCHAAGPFSFSGEHYTITDYNGAPKPIQPTMPLLIGGGGPRVLRFAAQHADIVGINATLTSGRIDETTFASMTGEAVDSKVDVVRQAAGERLSQIEMNLRAFLVTVTDNVDAAIATLAEFTGAPTEVIAASPFALVGPVDKIVSDLRERRERWGFSYIIVGQNDLESFAPVVAELAGT